MLTLDLAPLFEARAITSPFAFLRKAGFSHHTAHRLLNKPPGLQISYIDRLCTVLNCSPSDLFAYTPGAGQALAPGHPLMKLVRGAGRGNLTQELRRLSPDELTKLWDLIDEIKSTGSTDTP